MFQAGSETTSTFLTWLLIYLINYPEVQQKAQEEVDRVAGRDSLPTWDQKDDLHYIHALTYEVMRFADIAPFAGIHFWN